MYSERQRMAEVRVGWQLCMYVCERQLAVIQRTLKQRAEFSIMLRVLKC